MKSTGILTKILCAVVAAACLLLFVYALRLFPKSSAADTAVDKVRTRAVKLDVDMDKTVAVVSSGDMLELGSRDENNIYGFPTGELPYFLYVEKGSHTLSVFAKDHLGYYTVLCATYPVATGSVHALTPNGVFTLFDKEEWHLWPSNAYSPFVCKYYSRGDMFGGLYLHGPIYAAKRFNVLSRVSAAEIGTDATSGCLRLPVEAVYFLYECCDEGTYIKIVDGSPYGMTVDRPLSIDEQTLQPELPDFALGSKRIESIAFTEDSYTVAVGESFTPQIEVTPKEYSSVRLYYTCNNPEVVRVEDGRITALSVGNALVTARTVDGALVARADVYVTVGDIDTQAPPPEIEQITIDKTDNSIIEDALSPAEPTEYVPLDVGRIRVYCDDYEVEINKPAAPLIDKLGYKYMLTSSKSCAYTGYDKTFVYSYGVKSGAIQLFTIPLLKGKDTVCQFYGEGSCGAAIKTADGITIGDSLDDVIAAYGSSFTADNMVSLNGQSGYTAIKYWAGEAQIPGVPYIYFVVDNATKQVFGIGVFSARNFG